MTNPELQKIIDELKNHTGQLDKSYVPPDEIARQIQRLRKGIPPAHLEKPCTIDDGIKIIDKDESESFIQLFRQEAEKGRFSKFVPASGAASRMFKDLEFLLKEHEELPAELLKKKAVSNSKPHQTGLTFIRGIHKFAFYNALKEALAKDDLNLEDLLKKGKCRPIIEYTISEKGLHYSAMPKALILFHKYEEKAVTAMEEHLRDAISVTADKEGKAKLHFTLTPEHIEPFKKKLESVRALYEKDEYRLDVSWSSQSRETDTIALSPDDTLFTDEKGDWHFRPGGHGALLNNLNNLQADLVFVSNIDNVVPDPLKPLVSQTLQQLGGYLVSIQNTIFDYLHKLDEEKPEHIEENDLRKFLKHSLSIAVTNDVRELPQQHRFDWYRNKLDRPLRIAGMVKNEGHPGGGPFWVRNKEGEVSLQIVEEAQVDKKNSEQLSAFNASTHFNPVYLVCGLKNYKGDNFNLSEYRDNDTGFIAQKSLQGKDLKALELPGLWNGAMADWNTVFAEVPKSTFNPVKQVTDLLQKEHQP